MNVNSEGVQKPPILDFFMGTVPCPGGGERFILLGFGTDSTMWLYPAEFGIGPQHAAQLANFPGGKYLLINPATRQVMINARAVVELVSDPDWRRDWLAYVESMIREHKEVRARYESARNN